MFILLCRSKKNALFEVSKMNNGSRRALTGSIHKIREFELEKVRFIYVVLVFIMYIKTSTLIFNLVFIYR